MEIILKGYWCNSCGFFEEDSFDEEKCMSCGCHIDTHTEVAIIPI